MTEWTRYVSVSPTREAMALEILKVIITQDDVCDGGTRDKLKVDGAVRIADMLIDRLK